MRIIISPAKKMNVDTDSLPYRDLPVFLPQAERLCQALQTMTDLELKALWKCNDQIAALNIQRLAQMDLRQNLTPAILSYEGIQYRYMAPGVFSDAAFAYVQDHLRILSGFYGILRPMDGVTPYRLEMQAKLAVDGHKDLYAYWGKSLAEHLTRETDCILDLASKEYSQAVSRHLPQDVRLITCIFGEEKNGKILEKGTMCKMARGEMVRFLAEHAIEDPEDARDFTGLNYRYSPTHSTDDTYVFVKADTRV